MNASLIYLDNAATTPVDPRVARLMADYLTEDGTFANPASRSHMAGWLAEQAVEGARRQVADTVGADPREIVWTSGATEADNLALIGYMRAHRDRGHHLVTSTIEHKAVIDTAIALEAEGFEVSWVKPDSQGRITPDAIKSALRSDTTLVSVMAVNNELGTENDLQAIGRVVHTHGAAFHVDAAQAVGKIPLDLQHLPVDLMSLSAHKAYGPKGVGALFVRRGLQIAPLIHGGGHERGMRSGTLPTHQIVGMGEAFRLVLEDHAKDKDRLHILNSRFRDGVVALEGVHIHSPLMGSVPNIVNVGFDGVEGESLIMALRKLAISTGSACNSASVDPSYVLTEIGVPREEALASIRFSFGRFTRDDDIDLALAELKHALTTLRA
ncbi:cysteine desulfurase family protein [Larsenimonas suaedae]|uniref:cysteine desulfurase n=1 Tax=Larsenimonas suaedae TaxID=1851019 RepID=A0ABU1GSX7_9GAMM|nr:aminotransferase class V-fold PLP-dependent enzyme [Larsenimonas suaedae]MCM2972076.1 aminotransferase class V-fold PLP-dependent enzyme [Larsenimonas suaedae]MDR5895130.1 aminotransferase class V-fold PLP-dependent enzyme [Larsenimonas suaedae]